MLDPKFPAGRRPNWLYGPPSLIFNGHRVLFPRSCRESDHSPASSADVKNDRSYTSIPPYTFMAYSETICTRCQSFGMWDRAVWYSICSSHCGDCEPVWCHRNLSIQINQPTRCNNFSSLLLDVNRPDHDQQHCYHHAPTVKPEDVTAVIELLMTGVRTPETCWAVNKRQV